MSNLISLVEIKHQARIDSLTLSEHLGIQHKNVLELIKNNQELFQRFNPIAFQTRKGEALPQGGFTKSARIALLSEDQSYFLLTLVRNTEQAKALKFNLVKAFSNFRRGQQQAADYLPFYHELHDAVKALAAYAKANGSQTETAFFHITYNRLVNRACGFTEGQRQGLTVRQG